MPHQSIGSPELALVRGHRENSMPSGTQIGCPFGQDGQVRFDVFEHFECGEIIEGCWQQLRHRIENPNSITGKCQVATHHGPAVLTQVRCGTCVPSLEQEACHVAGARPHFQEAAERPVADEVVNGAFAKNQSVGLFAWHRSAAAGSGRWCAMSSTSARQSRMGNAGCSARSSWASTAFASASASPGLNSRFG